MLYFNKLLIFNQIDGTFAAGTNTVGGMLKIHYAQNTFAVKASFTNIDASKFGLYKLLFVNGANVLTADIDNLKNVLLDCPNFEEGRHTDCVLICVQNTTKCVAFATTRNYANWDNAFVQALAEKHLQTKKQPQQTQTSPEPKVQQTPQKATADQTESAYDRFVAATEDYYRAEGFDNSQIVKNLKGNLDKKYESIEQYSNAFEQYYAYKQGQNYFASVKNQLQQIFDRFPPCHEMMAVIPGSYWVRIDYKQSGKYFLMGLITLNDSPKYLCYAIPAKEKSDNYPQFAFYTQAGGVFYYCLCQDAQTGKSIDSPPDFLHGKS